MAKSRNIEIDLVEHLKSSYPGPTFLRPVLKADDVQMVDIGYSVVSVDVCETSAIANMTGYVIMAWTNPHLTWNPADWEGVKSLRLPRSMQWMPDIICPELFEEFMDERHLVVADHKGRCLCVPVIRQKIQATKLGDGHYTVPITLCSCTYDTSKMALRLCEPAAVDQSHFMEGRWHVTDGGAKLAAKDIEFENWSEKFHMATFVVDLKKNK